MIGSVLEQTNCNALKMGSARTQKNAIGHGTGNDATTEKKKSTSIIFPTTKQPPGFLQGGRDRVGRLTEGLGTLAELGDRLVTTDTTTPVPAGILVLVEEVGLGGRNERSQSLAVLGADVLQGDNSGGLLVNDRTETCLVLDNHVGDTHLAAQCRQEDDELDRVNIVGDDDERCLLGLDESDAVVETVLDKEGLLAILGGRLVTLGGTGLGLLGQTSLLLLDRLGLVLVQQLEELSGRVLVQGVTELSDRRRDLETLVEDDLLTLETDVLGPLDEAGQVLLGANVTACKARSTSDSEGGVVRGRGWEMASKSRALISFEHLRRTRSAPVARTHRYQTSCSSSRKAGSGPASWSWNHPTSKEPRRAWTFL